MAHAVFPWLMSLAIGGLGVAWCCDITRYLRVQYRARDKDHRKYKGPY